MGTMDDDSGWKSRVGKPIQDLVPPGANRGDPLPPESMRLREEIIRKDKERIRKKREAEAKAKAEAERPPGEQTLHPAHITVPIIPVSPEDEKAVDDLMARTRRESHGVRRPIYADVLARALRLGRSERIDLIVALVESLRAITDSPSGEGGE